MLLSHYSEKIFDGNFIDIPDDRHYCKPTGFWVSVDGEYDWKWWCEKESFHLERLSYQHRVNLRDNHNILILPRPEYIFRFNEQYKDENKTGFFSYINWPLVKKEYGGIIIAPYQWDLRLDERTNWYYTWDCASGCIWDYSNIESVESLN